MSEPEPCPVGPEGHRWTLTLDDGGLSISSGCDRCDEACSDPVNVKMAPVVGSLRFVEEHPNVGGWHFDERCDCGWWWEFTPGETTKEEQR